MGTRQVLTKFIYAALVAAAPELIAAAPALVVGVLFTPAAAHAEYRVFVLKIEDSTTGQSRTVMSTLDHIQYAEYHPVRRSEKVSIQDSWMCRRRSDVSQDINQAYCPKP